MVKMFQKVSPEMGVYETLLMRLGPRMGTVRLAMLSLLA